MSTETPTTEVFEDVDPNPDEILEEFGVSSPEELADGGGAHDPTTDDELDIDDMTAAELFDDLEDVDAADAADGSDVADGSTESTATDTTDEPAPFSAEGGFFEEFEGVFVGEPATTVHDDGVVDSTAADLAAVESMSEAAFEFGQIESSESDEPGESADGDADADADTDEATASESAPTSSPGDDSASASSSTLTVTASSDDLELVGPEPTPTRVTSDRFGSDLAAN